MENRELELISLTNEMYDQIDELRNLCPDFMDKIKDLLLNLMLARNIYAALGNDKYDFDEDCFDDYFGYIVEFENILNIMEQIP